MNKASQLKFYFEALCVYDVKDDEIISALLQLLKSTGSEAVLENQSRFFRLVSSHRPCAITWSRLILAIATLLQGSRAGEQDKCPPQYQRS